MRPAASPLRHLLVQDSAAGSHPLHVSGGHTTLVAQAVAVRNLAGQHVGDGLDSPVGMPGKSGQIVCWTVVAEVVQ